MSGTGDEAEEVVGACAGTGEGECLEGGVLKREEHCGSEVGKGRVHDFELDDSGQRRKEVRQAVVELVAAVEGEVSQCRGIVEVVENFSEVGVIFARYVGTRSR
jgi:hypothetical protein